MFILRPANRFVFSKARVLGLKSLSQVGWARFFVPTREFLKSFPDSGLAYKDDIRQLSDKGYMAFYRVNSLKMQADILHI